MSKTIHRCIRCTKKATFTAPKRYCTFHWMKWIYDKSKRDVLIKDLAEMEDLFYKANTNIFAFLTGDVKIKVISEKNEQSRLARTA